jgi:hypothetical protein
VVDVNFAGTKIENKVNEGYIEGKHVATGISRELETYFGIFDRKSSRIQIDRLSQVPFKRLTINMSFYWDGPTTPKYQTLVSTCRSSLKPWKIPEVAASPTSSLAIMVNTEEKQVIFLGSNDSKIASSVLFTLPFKVCKYTVSDYMRL